MVGRGHPPQSPFPRRLQRLDIGAFGVSFQWTEIFSAYGLNCTATLLYISVTFNKRLTQSDVHETKRRINYYALNKQMKRNVTFWNFKNYITYTWISNTMRTPHENVEASVMTGLAEGVRNCGRPRISWTDNIIAWTGQSGARLLGITWDRGLWSALTHPHSHPWSDMAGRWRISDVSFCFCIVHSISASMQLTYGGFTIRDVCTVDITSEQTVIRGRVISSGQYTANHSFFVCF